MQGDFEKRITKLEHALSKRVKDGELPLPCPCCKAEGLLFIDVHNLTCPSCNVKLRYYTIVRT